MDRNNLEIKPFDELIKRFTITHQNNFIIGSLFIVSIILIGTLWLVEKDSVWYDLLIAVSTSILASVIFYWLYSKVAEKAVLQDVAVFATNVATQKFLSFQKWTPEAVYDSGENSNKFLLDYRNAIFNSKFLWFKGNSGIRTSFTLSKLSTEGHQLTDVKLLLLDPKEKRLCRDLAQDILLKSGHFAEDEQELQQKTEEMIEEIYLTLCGLFDIRKKMPTQVAFFTDHLFFRSEIFSDGLFITYYLGGFENKFDPRQLFSNLSLAYEAFSYDFRKGFYSSNIFTFSSRMSEKEFNDKLLELGCNLNIAELRKQKVDRFKKFEIQTI